ncbi:MAG: phosphatase PAP2 family protein [Phaeodactylibacter sp.]|nr:phosphatase PAP2 family protein [Phaeodactylibacter sp.]
MFRVISENRFFFYPFGLFLMASGLLLLKIDTGDLILWCSDHRTILGNVFFRFGTRMGEEVIYLVLFIGALFIRFRYSILLLLTGFSVSLLSYLTKTFFQHPRPSLFFKKLDILDHINLVEGVELYSGGTSFPSGHTMSAFALYGLLAFLVRDKRWAGLFFFAMALMVGFSRIYLVQHFLKDIYVGSVFGVAIALTLYLMDQRFFQQETHWLNQSIPSLLRRKRSVAES